MTTLIVIPCLNEAEHIEPLVTQLLADNQGLAFRMVIADGGSTDGTIAIAERLASAHPNVTYLPNPKRLQSAAVNLAVERLGQDAESMIRLDAHAGYPPDYCRVLLQEAAETQADSVVVAMRTKGHTPFQKAVAAAQNSKLGNGGSAHRSDVYGGRWIEHGHHALMRVSTFRAIGGYDESFSHNEDAELDTRLGKAGHKIWLTGKTCMTYYPRASVGPLFRQYRGYGRGRARNLIKHHSKPKLRQLLPVAIAPALLLVLLAPFFALFALPLLIWAVVCLAYGAKLGYDARDQALFLAGPAAMIMHLAWSIGFWQGLLYTRNF